MAWPDGAATALKTRLTVKPQRAGQDTHSETSWMDCLL